MHPTQRLIWFAFLNWFLLMLLWGLTISVAGGIAIPIDLILAHLGMVPMLSHQYLLKTEGDRTPLAWKAGLAFFLLGFALDTAAFGWYLGQGTAYLTSWTTWIYAGLRLFLPPITARWLEPHLTLPSSGGIA